ncbi:SDR family NAD(P)-dependent oxidoreductase [Weissella hellenica]|uniref:NAD(P)-dependent dehydrogenase, short-chain alcohol dehydrogenase family n=1 Tax=Weissella hellenica TaxID=46256 RepID=A0A4Y4G8W4_WEIHE|nr:SDR family NAD(P)-dependent oxidoreductase [Weissella hellenica]NKY67249.1 SDR family NAD(P)-dependent oxidoreductase [Weissella hellenica]GED36138.1 dehydrogenase [Weissella hellenica]SCB99931.1 NAD(P)-dependent dehydrogenase, short-chain alcohol dehydrogenase family [Weissella hellenica]
MSKKIVLITGASNGIGRETALTLAKENYQLIIHGRNSERTKAVYDEIVALGNTDVSMITGDFSLLSEVAEFADKVKGQVDHLVVLYNNAGGQFGEEREVTSEGHEKTFAINTFAPFLLTKLLLPLLEKSSSARIVTQSSESYRQTDPILDDIELKEHYTFGDAYGLSKLYVWWLMREFDRDLQDRNIKNVTVNSVEPGTALDTGLQRISGEIPEMKEVMAQYRQYSWSITDAAAAGLYLITSPDVEGVSGKFYGSDKKEKNVDPKWISASGQKQIWDYTVKASQQFLK